MTLRSEVELWGERVSVDTVARQAGTIAYELMCNVKRVGFEYGAGPGNESGFR